MSHNPAPATSPRRSSGKALKPLAVVVLAATLSCSGLASAMAAPATDSPVVAANEAPAVLSSPSDVTVDLYQMAHFVASSSDESATQQWQVSTDGGGSWTDLDAETSSDLWISAATYDLNGNLYRAAFTNADGTTYTDAATLTVHLNAPTINTEPSDLSATSGYDAYFYAASLDDSDQAQWQVSTDGGDSWTDLEGQTSSLLSLQHVTFAMNGDLYRAVFTNAGGSTYTVAATLNVLVNAPQINTAPSDYTANVGENAWFDASASDGSAPHWQVSTDGGDSWTDIDGGNPYLELGEVTYAMNGNVYRAAFVYDGGTVYTDPATLTVVATAPTVTDQPWTTTVRSGHRFTFSAAAYGAPAPTVQWQVKQEDGIVRTIEGATSNEYSALAPTVAHSGWKYRAVFTNAAGSITTSWATLKITASEPVIVANPVAVSVNAGDAATFTASATADPAPTAQWQVKLPGTSSFQDIAGATKSSYSIKPSLADSGAVYRVRYSNAAGETFTKGAALTVHGQVPGAPTHVTAKQTGRGRVTATWAAPTNPGSSKIISYAIGYSGGQWGNGVDKPASARSMTFTHLARGKYVFVVMAVNAAGYGHRVTLPLTVR